MGDRHHMAKGCTAAMLLAAAVLSSACGSGGKGKAIEVAGNGAAAACTKDNCAPASPDFTANLTAANELAGWINEPVTWVINGVDVATRTGDKTSTRRIMVLLDRIPDGSTITPGREDEKMATEVKFTWTPKVTGSGTMDVILRDYDRCMAERTEEYCNGYKLLDKYDKKMAASLAWRVADKAQLQNSINNGTIPSAAVLGGPGGTVVNVSNTNCGPPPTTDSQINGKIMQSLIQVLMNPNAAMPVLVGALGSGLGGNTQPVNPNPC